MKRLLTVAYFVGLGVFAGLIGTAAATAKEE